jgi:D-amino-acid dehydrogenase
VLAAGSWSTALARSVGVKLPMQPAKGYHIDLSNPDERPGTTCVLAERFVAVTPLGDGLRLAGTVELSGLNLRVDERRVGRLLTGARSFLNGLEEARVESTWCGLRPMTADGLPVIGRAPGVAGVVVATGHAMMGFLLGPLTGRLVSEIVMDGKTSLDVAELGADRFSAPA